MASAQFRSLLAISIWLSGEANAIISLAGPEAERLAFGLTLSPPNSDMLSAKNIPVAAFDFASGANLAARSLPSPRHVRSLQMHWSAVEAIARALDLDDELSGEEVARLIEQNPPLR